MTELLPYFYGLLVFSVVAFLFILMGRIFMNAETQYFYKYESLIKQDDKKYSSDLKFFIDDYGKDGWKFERVEDSMSFGAGAREVILIFVKTKTKIRLF